MKAAEEGNEFFALGGPARQFDGAFDGLRTGITERHAALAAARSDLRKLLRQRRESFVVEISARHGNQAGGLLLDRLYHARVAMARCDDRDPCIEIEETVSVYV